jgi:hypothetical protein
MQPFSNDFLERWEHIIAEVNKTDVPIECIKKIVIKLEGKKQKTISVNTLRRQGLDWGEIEVVVNRTLAGFGDSVNSVDFIVDAGAVAELIQPETDKLLKSL